MYVDVCNDDMPIHIIIIIMDVHTILSMTYTIVYIDVNFVIAGKLGWKGLSVYLLCNKARPHRRNHLPTPMLAVPIVQ